MNREEIEAIANSLIDESGVVGDTGGFEFSRELYVESAVSALKSSYTAGLERAAEIAEGHYERLPNYRRQGDNALKDKVEEGYGNAVLNIATAIRAAKESE